MSPLVALVGFSDDRAGQDRRGGLRSPRRGRAAAEVDGAGNGRSPARLDTPSAAGRSSSWPYGSASRPADLQAQVAASGRADAVGQLHDDPAVASAIANRARRPEAAGLGRHDAADRHDRPDGLAACRRRWSRCRALGVGRRRRRLATASVTGVGCRVGGAVGVGAWASASRRASGVGAGRRGRRRRRLRITRSAAAVTYSAIAGRAGPAAVALAERARRRDERPVRQGALAERVRRHDDPDRTRAVVDRDARGRPRARPSHRRPCRRPTRVGPRTARRRRRSAIAIAAGTPAAPMTTMSPRRPGACAGRIACRASR